MLKFVYAVRTGLVPAWPCIALSKSGKFPSGKETDKTTDSWHVRLCSYICGSVYINTFARLCTYMCAEYITGTGTTVLVLHSVLLSSFIHDVKRPTFLVIKVKYQYRTLVVQGEA